MVGTVLMIALGWMLRSWFLLPDPSSCWVRMCHGAPETWAAPSRSDGPFQYSETARWPPHRNRTASPVDTNVMR